MDRNCYFSVHQIWTRFRLTILLINTFVNALFRNLSNVMKMWSNFTKRNLIIAPMLQTIALIPLALHNLDTLHEKFQKNWIVASNWISHKWRLSCNNFLVSHRNSSRALARRALLLSFLANDDNVPELPVMKNMCKLRMLKHCSLWISQFLQHTGHLHWQHPYYSSTGVEETARQTA